MLESYFSFRDLALVSHASKLPAEFGALSKACGAQRVTFGDQTTTRVHNKLAAIGKISSIDSVASLAFGAEA